MVYAAAILLEARGGVVNDLTVAEIHNQEGATILQIGALNGGQYGIVVPAGLIPQEIAVILSGNQVGNSFNASQHDYKLQVNNATLTSYNAGPIYTLEMGPPLNRHGKPAGFVTTPEGWVVYDPVTYHSESGEGLNPYDDNHLLFFRVLALDPASPAFDATIYNFFAASSSTRLISIQSYSDSTAGIPQLANDLNAPVSVYRDSSTSAYVAGPRPLGAAMDAGPKGSLIAGPLLLNLASSATMNTVTATNVIAGETYVLERRIPDQPWLPVGTNQAAGVTLPFLEPLPASRHGWYRVRWQP